jgi:CRP-like cAMP-binding protein
MAEKVQATLAGQALWRGLGERQLAEVAQAARWSRLEAGSFFFHQEEAANALYLLVQGQVGMAQVTPEGQQVILRIVSPGEPFGWIALTRQAVYPGIRAGAGGQRDAVLDTATAMAQLMERRPRIALNVLPLLAEQLQEYAAPLPRAGHRTGGATRGQSFAAPGSSERPQGGKRRADRLPALAEKIWLTLLEPRSTP